AFAPLFEGLQRFPRLVLKHSRRAILRLILKLGKFDRERIPFVSRPRNSIFCVISSCTLGSQYRIESYCRPCGVPITVIRPTISESLLLTFERRSNRTRRSRNTFSPNLGLATGSETELIMAIESRRDPERLLEQIEEEERREKRGRLKIFLGYAS